MGTFGPPALAVPKNQLDAMPLLTTQQYVDGTGAEALVVGGASVKYWSPTVLGILNADPGLVGATKWCLVGNWLDWTPCMHFVVFVDRVALGALTALPAMWVQVQFRLSTSDTPSASYVTGGTLRDDLNACYNMHTTAYTFAAVSGLGEHQRIACGWGPPVPGAVAMQPCPVTIPAKTARLILSWATNDPHAGGHTDLFTATMWGHS